MAQVSCEMTVPKDSRPSEGSLLLNVELSPMAAPHFEAGRRTDEAVCWLIFMYISGAQTFSASGHGASDQWDAELCFRRCCCH